MKLILRLLTVDWWCCASWSCSSGYCYCALATLGGNCPTHCFVLESCWSACWNFVMFSDVVATETKNWFLNFIVTTIVTVEKLQRSSYSSCSLKLDYSSWSRLSWSVPSASSYCCRFSRCFWRAGSCGAHCYCFGVSWKSWRQRCAAKVKCHMKYCPYRFWSIDYLFSSARRF